MQMLLTFLEQAARWVFDTSLKATILIALLMIIRLIFRDRLPAKWQHALWLLLIVRLLLPLEMPSPFSIFNMTQKLSRSKIAMKSIPAEQAEEKKPVPSVEKELLPNIAVISSTPIQAAQLSQTPSRPGWNKILAAGWLAVALGLAGFAVFFSLR